MKSITGIIALLLLVGCTEFQKPIEEIYAEEKACKEIASFFNKSKSTYEKHNGDWMCFVDGFPGLLGNQLAFYQNELRPMLRFMHLKNKFLN